MQLIENFLNLMLAKRDEKGATAVEYGLMVALIAVAIIAMVSALGGKLGGLFTQIATAI
jgi:pilus assembly protein Flp/PilA